MTLSETGADDACGPQEMSEWVLIIYLTTDLWVATAAYPNADACYQSLKELESEPGAHGACLQGTVVKPKKRRRR